jgi:hypothetical protein
MAILRRSPIEVTKFGTPNWIHVWFFLSLNFFMTYIHIFNPLKYKNHITQKMGKFKGF